MKSIEVFPCVGNSSLKAREDFFSIPCLFTSQWNNREITLYRGRRPFGSLSPPCDPWIVLSCKRDDFAGTNRLFREREPRQFGRGVSEKIPGKKSLHSFVAFRWQWRPVKERKKRERIEKKSKGLRLSLPPGGQLLEKKLSYPLPLAVSKTGAFN